MQDDRLMQALFDDRDFHLQGGGKKKKKSKPKKSTKKKSKRRRSYKSSHCCPKGMVFDGKTKSCRKDKRVKKKSKK
jgi:hypothetical protein